ncbi:hypothetical protein EMIT0111MI5_110048 [Burkholderia sp. IT-111MI5]
MTQAKRQDARRKALAYQEVSPHRLAPRAHQRMSHRDGNDFRRVGQAAGQAIERIRELLEYRFHKGRVDRLLRFEVVVERAEANVSGLGDLVDGDAFHALLRHQSERGVQQAGTGLTLAARTARLTLFGDRWTGCFRSGALGCPATRCIRHDVSDACSCPSIDSNVYIDKIIIYDFNITQGGWQTLKNRSNDEWRYGGDTTAHGRPRVH